MGTGEAGGTGRTALPPACLKAQLQNPDSDGSVSATTPHLPGIPLATAVQEIAKITKTVRDCRTVHVREVCGVGLGLHAEAEEGCTGGW